MIKLPHVFADNALFLHSSTLDIRGEADEKRVTILLQKDDTTVSEYQCETDKNGKFSATINTPPASYDEYTLTIKTDTDQLSLSGILFGELWLACGQSNMEMSHTLQPEWNELKELLKGKKIRAFYQQRFAADYQYPCEPLNDTNGSWYSPEDEFFQNLSAVASVFSYRLCDFFEDNGNNCPVGFLNTNRGGTVIQTWIPTEEFSLNSRIAGYAPNPEKWNTKGDNNYQQPSAHYNQHISPILGVKARGMLWYQGESNVVMENTRHVYKDFMIALRNSYKARFASLPDELFPMISVQIYPWKYKSEYEDTVVGYLNKAFSDMAKKYPEEYPFIPICDLEWIWGKWGNNHPIHPTHKYKVGDRLATLTLNKYYGRVVRNKQTLPPMLKSCVRHGNKLRLTFENVGDGLRVKGIKAIGLYIKSKDGVYSPAYYEIVSRNVMNVYHPYIEKPCHAAYAVSSLEPKTNLFAGEFPVTPFCTEFIDGVDNKVKISLKPWLNNELDNFFVGETLKLSDGVEELNFFNRAIFNPSACSGVCYDSDFAVTARSLRVYSLDNENKRFGAYILANQFASLDLENYSELKLKLFNHKSCSAKLILYYAPKDGSRLIHAVDATPDENGHLGWYEHSFELSNIPNGKIEKAEFSFINNSNGAGFVFMDDLILVPKN